MGPFLAEDDGLIWLSFFLEVSRPLCFCQGFVHPGGFVLKILTSYISLLCEFVYWSRNGFSNTSGPLIKDLIGSLPSLLRKPSVSSSDAYAEASVVWLRPSTPFTFNYPSPKLNSAELA